MTGLGELKAKWIEDPEFAAAYGEADGEYGLIEALISARNQAGLTQQEVAQRLGTTQSAVARLESGRTSPSLRTLQRYAQATGAQLQISIRPRPAA